MVLHVPQKTMHEKILLSGIHLTLTDALRETMNRKAGRLLRHNPHIVRVRFDLEHDRTRNPRQAFIAKGRIELDGPDLIASAESADGYKSVDALADKLDGLLARRHQRRVATRNDRRQQATAVLHGK